MKMEIFTYVDKNSQENIITSINKFMLYTFLFALDNATSLKFYGS